jgi:hypothetical protein
MPPPRQVQESDTRWRELTRPDHRGQPELVSQVQGVDVDFQLIRSWQMTYGASSPRRTLPARRKSRSWAFVAETLYGPDVDPTGETSDPISVQVIGVMALKVKAFGQDQDDVVFAAYDRAEKASGQQHQQHHRGLRNP